VFLVLAAVILLIPLFFSLEWNGAEAQQTKVVVQKASLPFDVRRSEVVKAAEELQSQLVSLDDFVAVRSGLSRHDQAVRMEAWQRKSEEIKAQYRIWGVVDAQHPDAVAEDALRNALLYLHSLKHLVMDDPAPEQNAEYQKIRASFEESLALAARQ